VLRYDVAVLRLSSPVHYAPHIAPICLPRAGLDPEVIFKIFHKLKIIFSRITSHYGEKLNIKMILPISCSFLL